MMTAIGKENENPFVLQNVRTVLEMIEEALQKPPTKMKIDVDSVENRLVRLRDHLIADHRRHQSDSRAFVQSPTLLRINTALSLIVSIGYPGAGIYREGLEEARLLLHELIPDKS